MGKSSVFVQLKVGSSKSMTSVFFPSSAGSPVMTKTDWYRPWPSNRILLSIFCVFEERLRNNPPEGGEDVARKLRSILSCNFENMSAYLDHEQRHNIGFPRNFGFPQNIASSQNIGAFQKCWIFPKNTIALASWFIPHINWKMNGLIGLNGMQKNNYQNWDENFY